MIYDDDGDDADADATDKSTGDDDAADLGPDADSADNDDNGQGHQIPEIDEVKESKTNANQFEDPIASPSVTGEEDVFSGDAPEGEPADIDDELAKVGLSGDEEHGPGSLDISDKLEE